MKSQGGQRLGSQHSNNKRNSNGHNAVLLNESTLVKNSSFGVVANNQMRNLIEPNSTLLGHLMPDGKQNTKS